MPRRRLPLCLALAAVLALAIFLAAGCRRKPTIPAYPGPKLPTAAPYKPPPTKVWTTRLPGQPTGRPTIPR